MTDERKRELTQLLQETLANLEIRQKSVDGYEFIHVNEYRSMLQRHWTSYSDSIHVFLRAAIRYEPHIVNGSTKSKLLDFIRGEFSKFIHEDHIQSASAVIKGIVSSTGYPLDDLLKQLLKIAIVLGVEKATSDFDRCTKNPSGSFQYIALLQGIEVEKEIQVFDGMRIVPLPHSTSELSHYFPYNLHVRPVDFMERTLLVINASISPIFCKPPPLEEDYSDCLPFAVEVAGEKFSNFKVHDFYEKFCQALSLTCNSAVQVAVQWEFLARDKLFNLTRSEGYSWSSDINLFGDSTIAGEAQIDEAKRLYRKMITLDANVAGKLQIPINRWIKSKTSKTPVDKVIDLGIAFEALYLSDTNYNREIRFRFSLHAAWHLEENKEQRKALMQEFKAIYDWRSRVVHTGKLPKKMRNKPEEAEVFIAKAQDLCRDSIMKILEDGKFPDWNDLILGEESL